MKRQTLDIGRRLRILLCAATAASLFVLPTGYAFARGGHGGEGHRGGHGGGHGGHAAMGHAGSARGGGHAAMRSGGFARGGGVDRGFARRGGPGNGGRGFWAARFFWAGCGERGGG